MREQLALVGRFDDRENITDFEWEVECAALAEQRLLRLETERHSRFECFQELQEIIFDLELYWSGLSPERQLATAKDIREQLRRCQSIKDRQVRWARSELGRQGVKVS